MRYIKNKFTIEKISVDKIAKQFGTPFYCYSHNQLKKILSVLKKNLSLFHLWYVSLLNQILMLI